MESSLVADYDSSSDENGDTPPGEVELQQSQDGILAVQAKSGSNNFFSGVAENDDSDNEATNLPSKVEGQVSSARLPKPLAAITALPSPNFSTTPDDSLNSVFITNFQRAEVAKQSILERHVKMTALAKEEPSDRQRKRAGGKTNVCNSFLNGRCRFGDKCRFSHELNPAPGDIPADVEKPSSSTANRTWSTAQSLRPHEQRALSAPEPEDEDSFGAGRKRAHRSGITDSLVPPKRAMSALSNERKHARPWTVKR